MSKTLLTALVLVLGSALQSCHNRNWNKWFGGDDSTRNERGPRDSSPDGCGVLTPGARIALSPTFEIRVRDPYVPMSLVQMERRYVLTPAEAKVMWEEEQAGSDCCDARGADRLTLLDLSNERRAELEKALAQLALAADLRCTTIAEVKQQIENSMCGQQAGHLVLLDSGRVIADSASCLPTRNGLWGTAKGLDAVLHALQGR